MIDVYLGMGSNLDNPCHQIRQAISAIASHPVICVNRASSFYANPPMGPISQPDYVNAVLKVVTPMPVQALLYFLQSIEQQQHRQKTVKWGPRTIDIDILLYGNQVINLPSLIIPHPGLEQRAFVMMPLLEIEPDLALPSGMLLKKAAQKIDCSFLTKLIKMRAEDEYTHA